MFATIVFDPPPLLFFVSETKGNPGKLSKPLVIIIMETKQIIWCWKKFCGKHLLSAVFWSSTFSILKHHSFFLYIISWKKIVSLLLNIMGSDLVSKCCVETPLNDSINHVLMCKYYWIICFSVLTQEVGLLYPNLSRLKVRSVSSLS